MRLRKRYVVALFGAALLLFLGIKYSLEWRTEFVSASQSLDHARVALAEGDSARGIVYLDQGLERASQDPEELSALIFEELGILDGAPPMHVQDAARLYRYRIDLQKRNCATQTWEKVLIKSVESLHWPEEEASAHFHMLHPGRELLEMSIARAETLDTFAAWNLGREIGQQLKDSGAVPEWAHVLRAMANLKACELDAMGTVNITVAPIMGWVRDAIIARPDDPQLQRAMDVSLAIASGDDRLADRILPRENPLVEAVSLSDAFAKEYPDCIPGLVNQIETRVRATELAAIQSEPDAQKLLDQFVANCPSEANWRDVLRAVGLQVRALAFQDPGSPDYAHGIANVRRLAGSLLERAPGAPDALLALGRLYRVLGQDATARDYFHQAAESKVLCSPSLRALTWDLSGGLAELELVDMDLLVLEGTSSPAVGDLPPITTRIDRAAERLGAGNGDVLLARGRVALLAGQPRIAVALLEKACERLGKLRPKAFLVSGATLTNLGEWGSAEKRLELYLSLPGTRAEQRLPGARKLAEALLRTHSPDEASLRIAKLTAAYPGDEELQLARARAVLHNALQTSANRVSRAARLAEVTAILDPLTATGNEAALLLAARSQALLGEGRDSMLGLETFCRNHPRNEAGIEDWCQALRLRGELDAEEQAIRSLVVPQASPPVRAMLTWALERKTRPRSVLDPLVKLAFVPDEAEQQLGLFWVHWGLDDSEACGKALAAGLAAAPHDAGLLGANLAFLLDAGKATAARQALGNLPDAAIPAWQRQLWQAKVLLAVREQEKAKRLLDSLAKEYPHLSEAIALQGVLSMQSGQTAAATLQFENALRVNPLQPIALDGMTRIAIDGHEPVLAFGYLRKLVRLGTPSQPRFTAQLLDQLTLCGTLTGSIRLREHLREQSPWDRANLRELALLHLKSRQIGQATEILRQLTHDDPSDLATAVLLARTLREQTLGGEARDLLVAAAAASADPATDPESLAVAGMLEELGASQAAQDLLAKASQGQGAIATAATIRLGNLLYHGQQWAKAASTYAALPDAQTRPDLLRREVECRIRTGELPQAKALLDNLQRLEPNQPLSHVLAAELALASGDLAWARSACAQAFAQDPGCALAFLMRARIALRGDGGKKALDGAVDDLQRRACETRR
jgi:Tfp pilus assembly protein PilF